MRLTSSVGLALLATFNVVASTEIRRQSSDTEVRVTISDQGTETGSQVQFDAVTSRVVEAARGGDTLFTEIDVFVGPGAQQDLRCQAIGMTGKPLIATRGENV